MNDLEAIVRQLARVPLIATYADNISAYCVCCGAEASLNQMPAFYDGDTTPHEPDCFWVRARRAIEAMP